jgi:hypothetical protein
VSPVRHRRRLESDNLQGEMTKLKPSSFDGEREREDDAETWLLGITKYFQLHNYLYNLEARISLQFAWKSCYVVGSVEAS